jgi:ParB-like chromosome segregation protein Spo0J
MIHESLKGSIIDIDSIKPHPKNARQGDVGMIATSLELNGQYRPIIIQESTGFIIAGNHTWKAAKSLGWKEIAATKLSVDEDQSMRILLADNKANDLASYDDSDLLSLLIEMNESDRGLEGTLFSNDDIDDLMALLESNDLQDVIEEHGLHDGTDGFTATIKATVSLETFEAWDRLWQEQEGSDDERINRIIDLVRK